MTNKVGDRMRDFEKEYWAETNLLQFACRRQKDVVSLAFAISLS